MIETGGRSPSTAVRFHLRIPFRHLTMNTNSATSPSPRVDSPAIATITTQALNAPVFVPKFAAANTSTPAESDATSHVPQSQNRDSQPTTAEEMQYQYEAENGYQDQGDGEYVEGQSYEQEHQDYGQQDYAGYQGYDYQVDEAGNALQGMELVRARYAIGRLIFM